MYYYCSCLRQIVWFRTAYVQLSDTLVSYDSQQLISNKYVHAHVQSSRCRHEQLLSFDNWRPSPRNHRIYIIFLDIRVLGLHFAADRMSLSSFKFLVGSKTFFQQECVLAIQGHPRSLILVLIKSAYATSY